MEGMTLQRGNRSPTLGVSNLMYLNGIDSPAVVAQRSSVGPMMAVLTVGAICWLLFSESKGR